VEVLARETYVVLSIAAAAPAPTGPTGSWRLVFQDEFAGAALDQKKWSTGWMAAGITGTANSAENACHEPANVAVGGGVLSLALTQRPVTQQEDVTVQGLPGPQQPEVRVHLRLCRSADLSSCRARR
jgi:hypothetical protein